MEVFSLHTKEEQSLVVPSTVGTQTRASGVRAAEVFKLNHSKKQSKASAPTETGYTITGLNMDEN